MNAALTCREKNYGAYGISGPLINPWTSHPAIVDIANELFTSTAKLIEQPSSEAEQPVGRVQARDQLPQLASILFLVYHERLEYLARYVTIEYLTEVETNCHLGLKSLCQFRNAGAGDAGRTIQILSTLGVGNTS